MFDAAPETLDEDVVEGSAPTIHADHNPLPLQNAGKGIAGRGSKLRYTLLNSRVHTRGGSARLCNGKTAILEPRRVSRFHNPSPLSAPYRQRITSTAWRDITYFSLRKATSSCTVDEQASAARQSQTSGFASSAKPIFLAR